jgi:two-component system response regulator GlrR
MAVKESTRVLLVDDDESLLKVLAIRLSREGYEVQAASSGKKALGQLSNFAPHVVVSDMRMDGMDGLSLLDEVQTRDATLPVILLTAHGTIPDAVEATQRGAFAYLTKPFEKSELLEMIERAVSLFGESAGAAADDDVEDWAEGIVTRSSAMQALLRDARLVAQSDSSVLLRGESGTGKELLARAIHRASPRADRPLVPVNCTAIPEQLFEAELFGHAKGAFTGADKARRGLAQAADGGTLFLDEIGDMPLAAQAKLLRMLEEQEVRPVGSTQTVKVDVRIISATHQNLETLLEEKRFREDLYYRLNVVMLEIPSLDARREDIPLLVEHLADVATRESNSETNVKGFSNEALELMMAAPWPGNVRQLRNVVEQCLALATTPIVPASLVERALRRKEKAFLPFAEARDRFEFEYLTQLLEMTEGNVAQAARLAERNRSEFYKLLHKHELEPELFREQDSENSRR